MSEERSSPQGLAPEGEGELGYGDKAPSMPSYFLGYGIIFGGVVGFALLLVLLMKLLR